VPYINVIKTSGKKNIFEITSSKLNTSVYFLYCLSRTNVI